MTSSIRHQRVLVALSTTHTSSTDDVTPRLRIRKASLTSTQHTRKYITRLIPHTRVSRPFATHISAPLRDVTSKADHTLASHM